MNNGDIDLDRNGVHEESVCYTAVNPFHVRLLKHDKRRVETKIRMPKKRGKSPLIKEPTKDNGTKSLQEQRTSANSDLDYGSTKLSSQRNCSKLSIKLGKFGVVRCTPESKRRRRSRFVEPVDLHSAL